MSGHKFCTSLKFYYYTLFHEYISSKFSNYYIFIVDFNWIFYVGFQSS